MDTIDLGFEAPDYSGMNGGLSMHESPKEAATKTCYPSMTIPGNAALARSLKPGQEFTAMVKFRVSEVAIRERDGDEDEGIDIYGGTHVELEAQKITFEGIKIEAMDREDGASAFAKFMGKKPKGGASD